MYIKNINQNMLQELRKKTYFKDLTDEQFALISRDMTYHEVKKGQVIFEQGEPITRLYVILNGLAELNELDFDGNEFFHYVGPENLYPLSAIPNDDAEFQATGEALSNLEFVTINLKNYQKFVVNNSKLAHTVMLNISRTMNEYKNRLAESMIFGTGERIIKILSNLAIQMGQYDQNGNLKLPFKTSFIDLAKICGTTRETMSRTINELTEQGILAFNHKQLTMIQCDAQLQEAF